MKINPLELPYRKAVHVYIFDDAFQHLLITRHVHNEAWSIPGGGIEGSEAAIEAATREIMEEFGIEIEILFESKHVRRYDWPESLVKRYLEHKGLLFRGQNKIPIVACYTGDPHNLIYDKREIIEYKWAKINEIPTYFAQDESKYNNIRDVIGDVDTMYNTNLLDFLIKS